MNEIKSIDTTLIYLSGKATLLELKIKLLLSRDNHEIKKRSSCSEAKQLMYDKYSKYICEEDREIIDNAVWVRNKLVHFELHEIFSNQEHIQSKVVSKTVGPNDSVIEVVKDIQDGKANPVNKGSSLYGQYLELGRNSERIEELQDVLDKAIKIIYRIACEPLL